MILWFSQTNGRFSQNDGQTDGQFKHNSGDTMNIPLIVTGTITTCHHFTKVTKSKKQKALQYDTKI